MRVLIFYTTLPGKFLTVRIVQRDIIINVLYMRLHIKHALFLSDVNETGVLSTNCLKTFKYKIL